MSQISRIIYPIPNLELGSAGVRKAASPERGAYKCAIKQSNAFSFT